jgi:hypothetical protein
MLHILIPVFAAMGVATMFCHIVEILIFLFSKIKKRMKYERKIKFLCKHIYEINSICGDGEVEVTCLRCGKKKFIRFSLNSLTEFRMIGGKK